jgi:type II secretory pathway component PulF
MSDRIGRELSWGITFLCALYILWECYQLKTRVPVMAKLLAGIGSELPNATRFVIQFASSYAWPVGMLLALLLVGKELLLRDTVMRLAITFVVFLGAAWFFSFAITAMAQPLQEILQKIS